MTTRRDERQGRREARKDARNIRKDARDTRKEARAAKRAAPERRRRPPELARTELLDAAERVFASHAPDEVGLKEIAREAGVSHALITHYFGTYAGLIEATLQRRLNALRETMILRLGDAGVLSRPEELLAILFRTFDDPVHLRLMKWMVGTERAANVHALAMQHQGLQIVARQVATALMPGARAPLIERIELALMTSVAAALGYAVAKYALAGAAGREVSSALDASVQATLAGMLRTYLAAQPELAVT
jgi:TetR/AcrR family transcriptional regulator, repressor for neighboring sulfatase